MPKWILEETVPSYVTWRRTIEAPTLAEAWEAFDNGEGTPEQGPMIGDAIETVPVQRDGRLA